MESLRLDAIDERYKALRLVRPELVEQVLRSVERYGLLQPVVVNAMDGRRVLLDGFKRVEALRRLGQTEIPVRVVEVEEAAAQAALITYNVAHQGLCDLEEAWVVRSLVRSCQLKQKDVAELLGRHKSWVCRRLQLAERLTQPLQDDMRLGLLRASTARELVRLPRGNQGEVAEAVRQHGLTARQAARLVEAVATAADPDALQPVLADPLRYVGSDDAEPAGPAKDPRLSAAGETIRRSLLGLSRAAAWACQALDSHPVVSLSDADAEVLAEIALPVVDRADSALVLARRLLRPPPT